MIRPRGRQLDLLRRAPSFRNLFLATLASGIGTYLAVIALIVDVYDRTDSASWVSALLVVEFLPVLLVGLALGPLVDRLPRRLLMIGADLVRFAAFAALPFATNALTIVILAGVAGTASAFFRPAVYAGMPNTVGEDDLPHANSLFQTVENLTWTLGPLIGGALLAVAGPSLPYAINAATFLVSAAFLFRIPERLLQLGRAASKGHLRDLADGFRLVRTSRPLLTVLVVWTVVMVANGQVNVSEVALAKDSLDGGNFGLGVLMAAAGVGLVAGSVVGGSWIQRRTISEAYGAAIAMMALGVGIAAVSPTVWVAFAWVVVFGVGNGIATVCNPVLVQRGAPDELRGRAFTVIMSVNASVLGLSIIGAGPLTDALGARWAWGIAAAVYAVAALVALAMARGSAARRALGEQTARATAH